MISWIRVAWRVWKSHRVAWRVWRSPDCFSDMNFWARMPLPVFWHHLLWVIRECLRASTDKSRAFYWLSWRSKGWYEVVEVS